jgi:hypothetical protein
MSKAESGVPLEICDLVAKIIAEVERRKGELPMSQILYYRWKVSDDFAYGDNGVVANRGVTGQPFLKQSWEYAGALVANGIVALPEFDAAKKVLANSGAELALIDTFLSNFVMRIAARVAAGEIRDAEQATAEIDNLISSISPGPKEHRAKVELLGLILRCPQIDLPSLIIRQTRREDLEKDVLASGRTREPIGAPYPSAIAELEVVCAESALHNEVLPKLVAMLRLFKVAAVKHCGYRASWGTGTTSWHPGDHTLPTILSYIGDADVPRLKAFWRQLEKSLPKHLYEPSPSTIDYLSVAYERYCAGLLRGDIFEERVANAVMGLEALLMEEKQELTYRCRLRAARALSYLGEDAKHVFDVLGRAYNARNAFAHGDRLSEKDKKKMGIRYGDYEVVYRSVMNYLRKALVSSIVGTQKKRALIRALDESLVDPANDGAAAAFFAPAGGIV